MVNASELIDASSPMAGDLAQGMTTVALNQTVPFSLYGRVVLPIDGYVFWVKAQLLKQPTFQPSGLVTAAQLSEEDMATCAFEAKCSVHLSTDFRQEEAENYGANRVLMTTTQEIQQFNAIDRGMMWIGEFAGLKFGFSGQSKRYYQAGLWHYFGFALYPDMQTQVVDSVAAFSSAQVVSNSLPAWLEIQSYAPAWGTWGPLPPMFPSFLVPDNEPPPYISVHILPEGTKGLASAPTIRSSDSSHTQLCSDVVRLTLFGTRNTNALDFVDAMFQFMSDTDAIGLMSPIPIPRDDKRTQSELRTIAMKKVIDVEVSYLQHRMNTIGKKQIKNSTPNLYVNNVKIFPEPDDEPSA